MTDNELGGVEAALERAQRTRGDAETWTIDATRSQLLLAFAYAFEDRATLAAELLRLRREHALCRDTSSATRWANIPDDRLVTCAVCGVEIAAERAFPRGSYFGQWLCIDHVDNDTPSAAAGAGEKE